MSRNATLSLNLLIVAAYILPQAAIGVVAFNLIAGLIFSAALLGVLYWLGQFWLSGVKVIVPIVAVFVAYKSTFPLLARSKQ